MRKWALGLDTQRKENAPRTSTSPDMPPPEFSWVRAQGGNLENPYLSQQHDSDDDDFGQSSGPQIGANTGSTGGTMTRNASSSSLRQRSATGESTQSLAGIARAPPPRFPLPQPPVPLSVQTQLPSGASSPVPRGGDSYFSPVAESPASSRTSTTSGMFSSTNSSYFPKLGGPQPGWEDNNRYTAPAMPRAPSRDGPSPSPYGMNGRNPRGPSLPVMPQNPSSAQQQRSRSYSTPDINGPPGMRRTTGGTPVPAVPGIPPHLHPAHDGTIPRSQTGSPRNDLPIRSNTQSPGAQRERAHGHQTTNSYGGTMSHFPAQPLYSRQTTPGPMGQPMDPGMPRTASPTLGTAQLNSASNIEMPLPTQLKVKVNCESGNYVTLVVGFNITYQSLIDRIDAKLARFTTSSIGKGVLKLRYRDEDGDFVTIESDDDIQICFLEWREGARDIYSGGVGEIELYCVGETS
jgi:cell division control protein 24